MLFIIGVFSYVSILANNETFFSHGRMGVLGNFLKELNWIDGGKIKKINNCLTQRRNVKFFLIYYYLFIDLVEEEQSSIKSCVRDFSSCVGKTRGSSGSRKEGKKEEEGKNTCRRWYRLLTLNDVSYPRLCQWQQSIYIYIY